MKGIKEIIGSVTLGIALGGCGGKEVPLETRVREPLTVTATTDRDYGAVAITTENEGKTEVNYIYTSQNIKSIEVEALVEKEINDKGTVKIVAKDEGNKFEILITIFN